MLANFFGKSKPINSVILIIVFLILVLLSFLNGNFLLTWSLIPLFLLTFAIVNFIVVKNSLTFDNSYVFLFFVLLLGFFPKVMVINTSFYTNLTLLLVLRKTYSLQSSKLIFKKVFDAGFWLGISFLLEPFTLLFALLLYSSIYLFGKLTLQMLFVPVLGFVVPVFLYFTYCFWYDKTTEFTQLFFWSNDYDFSLYQNVNYLISIISVGLLLLFSIAVKTPKALAVKNLFRISWILIVLHLILSIILILLIKNRNGNEFLFVIFPSAIILANGLEIYQKKPLVNLIIVAFFVVSIIMTTINY